MPVYALDELQPGHSLTGPAIIEAETTTVLVDTGDRVSVNALGWLDISCADVLLTAATSTFDLGDLICAIFS